MNMTCEKCGGEMKQVDEHTMKCEGCGNVMNTDGMKKDDMGMMHDDMHQDM